MTKTYFENKFKILATHCVICGRPLNDPFSVERGIGPVCSKQYVVDTDITEEIFLKLRGYMFSLEDDHPTMSSLTEAVEDQWKNGTHKIANTIIYWASAHYENKEIVLYCAKLLRVLELTRLADKLEQDRVEVFIKEKEGVIHLGLPSPKYPQLQDLRGLGLYKDSTMTSFCRKDVYTTSDLSQEKKKRLENFLGHHYAKKMALVGSGFFGQTEQRILHIPQKTLVVTPTPSTTLQTKTTPKGIMLGLLNPDWLEVYTPYNANFVQDLKMLPRMERKWDANKWLVASVHKSEVEKLLSKYFQYNAPLTTV